MYPNWFIDPDDTAPVAYNEGRSPLRVCERTFHEFGWIRNRFNRTIDSEDRQIAYLRILSTTALEGYFTCHIDFNPKDCMFSTPVSNWLLQYA